MGTMTTTYDYDLVVIGSGPAGEKGAAKAAFYGKRVAIIERANHVGGAGINTGTLPSKTLRETALYFSGLRQRGLYGIDYSLKDGLTIEDFMYRKNVVTESEWDIINNNLAQHNIDLIHGAASFKDAHTVQVKMRDGTIKEISAEVILIATGSSPYHPEGIPFDHPLVYDSDSILHMFRIPKSLTIIGGGVIGSEYAGLFTALGVQVTLVDGRPGLLSFLDREISQRLQDQLESLGLRFIFNRKVDHINVFDDGVHLHLDDGERLDTDAVLYAAGRTSNVETLGLETVGVDLGHRGIIVVNEKYQTSVPNIFAAGDVIGFPALASTSMEQARAAMVHAFDLEYGEEQIASVLPFAVYTIPEISTAGLTEEQCQEQGIDYLVGRATYDKNARGQIIGDLSGMLKLIFSSHDKKLLGVHHIGEGASELIHIGAYALSKNDTIDAFIQAVFNYPTLADTYKYAAYDGLGRYDEWQKQHGSTESQIT